MPSESPPTSGARPSGSANPLPEAHEASATQGGSVSASSAGAAAASEAAPEARSPRLSVRADVATSAEPLSLLAPVVRSDRDNRAEPLRTAEAHEKETLVSRPAPASRSMPPDSTTPLPHAARLASRVSPFASAPPLDARAFDTGFGGLFYLLNVALHLGLYPDFTRPRAPGLAQSPWDLLAWLGHRWFGRAMLEDPLWIALAQWSGRDPAQDPAAGFVAPVEWQVPTDWLEPFEPLPLLTLRRVGQRRLLRHPDGFCLLDLDADAPVPEAWSQALAERPSRLARRFEMPQRWLAHLARYLRARCALALQVHRGEVPAFVLRHRARVSRTADGVTVRLSLAELPLPLRIAGLDRDPGWLPAAGCSVRFVFD